MTLAEDRCQPMLTVPIASPTYLVHNICYHMGGKLYLKNRFVSITQN